MLWRDCAGLAVAVFISSAHAEPAYYAGMGVLPCSTVNVVLRSSPDLAKEFLDWAQGFLSGMNEVLKSHNIPVTDAMPTGFGSDVQRAYLIGLCREDPQLVFAFAVRRLWDELRKRQGLPPLDQW